MTRNEKEKNREVGERIRELRKSHGWTQEELAEKADIEPVTAIGKIENGDQRISVDRLYRITKVDGVNMTMDEIWNGRRCEYTQKRSIKEQIKHMQECLDHLSDSLNEREDSLNQSGVMKG